MRLKMSLILPVLISSALTSCAFLGLGEPQEPEVSQCRFITHLNPDKTLDVNTSYVFCASSINPNDTTKQTRTPMLDYILKTKPIMTSPDGYAALTKWGADLTAWGKTHCTATGN